MKKALLVFVGTTAVLLGSVVIKEEIKEPEEKVIVEKKPRAEEKVIVERPHHRHVEEKIEIKRGE